MIRFEFSDEYQQYRYFVTLKDLGALTHMLLAVEYHGPKFPAAIRSKTEMFMNKSEWKNFKDIINAVV